MVGGPANPLGLAVRRRIDAQRAVPRSGLADVESIDPVGVRAVDQEEVDLIRVIRRDEGPDSVDPCTHGVEPDYAVTKTPCLALRPEEAASNVDHQVVAMVVAVRNEHPVPALDRSAKMTASLRSPTSTG